MGGAAWHVALNLTLSVMPARQGLYLTTAWFVSYKMIWGVGGGGAPPSGTQGLLLTLTQRSLLAVLKGTNVVLGI